MSERGERWTWRYLALWREQLTDSGERYTALDLDGTRAHLGISEADAAVALRDEWAGGLNWAADTKEWFVWDGRCHARDASEAVGKIVWDYGERLRALLEAVKAGLEHKHRSAADPAKAVAQELLLWEPAHKFASALRTTRTRNGVASYLAVVCGISYEQMAERNPELLNVANGTLDLRTGKLRPHDPADRITYCLDVGFNWYAQCPEFIKLLKRLTHSDDPDADPDAVALYLLKLLGYALLGDNREQKIIFLRGPTGSGKSTLLSIVADVLGPLAHNSQPGLITYQRHGRNARAENSIRGRRFLAITETSARMSIEESQVKRLTGEHEIVVDQHYNKIEIKTPVSWLIFVATNIMPSLVNYDDAMHRRVIVIPCGDQVEDMISDLRDRILDSEREGILRLLAWACADYLASGHLDPPWDVQKATTRFAIEQDTVAQFLEQTTVTGGWISQAQAWKAYQDWSNRQPQLQRNGFHEQMRRYLVFDGGQKRYVGVSWNPEWSARAVW